MAQHTEPSSCLLSAGMPLPRTLVNMFWRFGCACLLKTARGPREPMPASNCRLPVAAADPQLNASQVGQTAGELQIFVFSAAALLCLPLYAHGQGRCRWRFSRSCRNGWRQPTAPSGRALWWSGEALARAGACHRFTVTACAARRNAARRCAWGPAWCWRRARRTGCCRPRRLGRGACGTPRRPRGSGRRPEGAKEEAAGVGREEVGDGEGMPTARAAPTVKRLRGCRCQSSAWLLLNNHPAPRSPKWRGRPQGRPPAGVAAAAAAATWSPRLGCWPDAGWVTVWLDLLLFEPPIASAAT